MNKTLTAFEQQVQVDKAMEALMPLAQTVHDAGVSATVWKDVSDAFRLLNRAYCALAVERDAEMYRKYKASQ